MRPNRYFGHFGQARRVRTYFARFVNNPIVARDFPFDVELLGDVENRGVEEKQRLDHTLEAVCPVICTAQVRELVQHDLIHFFLRKRLEQMLRNEDHRVEQSDRDGNFNAIADTQANVASAFLRFAPPR